MQLITLRREQRCESIALTREKERKKSIKRDFIVAK